MKRVLDLGCGKRKQKGSIGVDININSDADVICDLDHYPYPFLDDVFDVVYCIGVLEHISDVFKTMEEIHRICKKGGSVIIRVPFISSLYLGIDPTHKRGFTSQSFDYFVEGTPLQKQYPFYTQSRFKIIEVSYNKPDEQNFRGSQRWWDKFFLLMANRFKRIYESRFRYIYPVTEIYFRLEVVKNG
jgi:ubiquinone/menaquinone biosynthesis C-methylase UbiE